MIGLLRHPAVLLVLVVGGGLLFVGSVAPSPENWTRSKAERTLDVHVLVETTWHPLRGEWEIGEVTTTAEPSRFLNLRAYFANTFSLTSPSERVVVTLTDPASGAIVQRHDDSTGRGGIFGSTSTSSVWFRQVEPVTYELSVKIVTDQNVVLAERSQPVQFVQGGYE